MKRVMRIWSLTIGGSETEFGYQVVATPDSGCMIIGETNSFGAGISDFLITKVDKNGIIEYFIDSIEVTHEEEMLIYPIPVHQQGRIRFKNNTFRLQYNAYFPIRTTY